MRILGVPSAAHREALLRETAGGGRVPTRNVGPATWTRWKRDHTVTTRQCDWQRDDGYVCVQDIDHPGDHAPHRHAPVAGHPAIILHDAADPEAGAMGLARLAWVAWDVPSPGPPTRRVGPCNGTRQWMAREGQVWLHDGTASDNDTHWTTRYLPALATATHPAHAIGLVCVHLGLLDRVEVTT